MEKHKMKGVKELALSGKPKKDKKDKKGKKKKK